jgi:muramoyltetrapeptide carboxypeptidase
MRPPPLRAGARVALLSPAGPVVADRLATAVARCEELGLVPVVGRSALERHGYLAGPDEARAADFQQAIDDDAIDAIWALRGGYGTMRLLERLDLRRLRERPRAFIGFSDNTALHLAFDALRVVSFHGPHAGGPFPPFTAGCFRRVLFEEDVAGVLPLPIEDEPPSVLRGGAAEGELTGGNLSLLAALCGTPMALQARGRIVVLEEVGESTYRIDRALTQLRLARALDGAAGLVLGHFTERGEEVPGRRLEDVFAELADTLGAPAVLGFPIGHREHNWTLPFGVRARLDADALELALLEPAVMRAGP